MALEQMRHTRDSKELHTSCRPTMSHIMTKRVRSFANTRWQNSPSLNQRSDSIWSLFVWLEGRDGAGEPWQPKYRSSSLPTQTRHHCDRETGIMLGWTPNRTKARGSHPRHVRSFRTPDPRWRQDERTEGANYP
ncbi:unnamed protein product [Boreogadus saida]